MLVFFTLLIGWAGFIVAAAMHLTAARALPKTLIFLLIVLVPLTVVESRWRWNEHRLTVTARELTGIDDVEVLCQRLGSDLIDVSPVLGYVAFNADGTSSKGAHLRRETCRSLADFRRSTESAGPAQWLAVHVLTHEAMHLAGLHDEAQAECAAQQRDGLTAVLLGASARSATRLGPGYRATGFHLLPERYQSPDCVDGGAWTKTCRCRRGRTPPRGPVTTHRSHPRPW